MTTMRYGTVCAYISAIMSAVLAVIMLSFYLRIFGMFTDILDIFDPVTEWLMDSGLIDVEHYITSIVANRPYLHAFMLELATLLLFVSFVGYISGFSDQNKLRKASAMGLIGCILVFSEFMYSGNNAFALIILAVFLNVSVLAAVPKEKDGITEEIEEVSTSVYTVKSSDPKAVERDNKAHAKYVAKIEKLGDRMFVTVSTSKLEGGKVHKKKESKKQDCETPSAEKSSKKEESEPAPIIEKETPAEEQPEAKKPKFGFRKKTEQKSDDGVTEKQHRISLRKPKKESDTEDVSDEKE